MRVKYLSPVLAGLLLLIAGCSTPDNSEPPAELTTIEDAQSVRQLWSIDTGRGSEKNFYDLQPLVIDDKILTIDTNGVVQQTDATRGKRDWQYDTGLKAITGLEGNSGYLLATSGEGKVALYRRMQTTLEPVWQQKLNSEVHSPAVMDGNQVFVRTVDGRLSALDINDGSVQWSASRQVPALSLTGTSSPIVTDDLVISGFDNGKLVAFERDTGATAWETTVGSPSGRTEIERLVDLDGQFLVRDGVIYISAFQSKLAAVTVNSGQVIWNRDFSSFQAIDADEEALYLTDEHSHIWSIDRRTGSAFWKQDVLNARKLTAPRLVGDKLVVADLAGYVHWLNKLDGKLVARAATMVKPYISQPVAEGSNVYVLDITNQLTALTLK